MLSPRLLEGQQIPLIHEVHSEDKHLLNTIDGEWFEILCYFPWEDYRVYAADYYNALYDFNQQLPHRATTLIPVSRRFAMKTKKEKNKRSPNRS
ncbi:MAG: hypothetical protein GY703_03665 [Gammaproteobacteria bacterium]|nr:hypothetical protein [Gammaproteobacteria bacterium]